MTKARNILIIETAIIAVLVVILLNPAKSSNQILPKDGLLSPRVYLGLLEPKSYLITNFEPLKKQLIDEVASQNISVYVENLRDGANFDINPEKRFFPLSLNKLPVGMLIMQKVEEGKLSPNSKIEVTNKNRDRFSGDLYKDPSASFPLNVLMEKMLSQSDNTAFYALLDYLDRNDLNFLLDYFPLDLRVYYLKNITESAYKTSSSDYSNVFRSLYFSTVLNAKSSEYIMRLLLNNTLDINKLADIPNDIKIAHKFGLDIRDTKSMHDCGIMYIPARTRILYCVMSEGLEKEEAEKAIGSAINKIYRYILDARAHLEEYKNQG